MGFGIVGWPGHRRDQRAGWSNLGQQVEEDLSVFLCVMSSNKDITEQLRMHARTTAPSFAPIDHP